MEAPVRIRSGPGRNGREMEGKSVKRRQCTSNLTPKSQCPDHPGLFLVLVLMAGGQTRAYDVF